jgi:hypothetical protein
VLDGPSSQLFLEFVHQCNDLCFLDGRILNLKELDGLKLVPRLRF